MYYIGGEYSKENRKVFKRVPIIILIGTMPNFEQYLDLRGYAKNTKYQYLLYEKHLLYYIYKNNSKFNQEVINQFIAERNHLPARAFLKCYLTFLKRDPSVIPEYRGRIVKKQIKYLNYDEIIKLENHADLRMKVLLKLLFESGLRISEAIALQIKDVDWISNKITGIGKGNLEFIEDITKETSDLLRIYTKGRDGKVFPIGVRWARELIRKIGEEVLDKKVYPHMLRHSYGTYLLTKGYNLKEIQELLRHKRLETTGIYAQVQKEALRKKKLSLFTKK